MHANANPTPEPVIKTRSQLEIVLENLLHVRRELDQLFAERDAELDAVRRKYQSRIDNLANLVRQEEGWVWTWAEANPSALGAARRLECAHATLGYEKQAPFLDRASRRWTWSRIVEALRETTWGAKYLKTSEPQVDKDALLADLDKLSVEDLRAAGIKVFQGDRFFIADKSAKKE